MISQSCAESLVAGGVQPAVPAALACGGVSALRDAHLRREASA